MPFCEECLVVVVAEERNMVAIYQGPSQMMERWSETAISVGSGISRQHHNTPQQGLKPVTTLDVRIQRD
ncbi:hypothetical protein Pmani_016278 [Petrolisthes manimaculis]|uniref:Uncharacterized protein n=1 Tax=Petrolisthes manimaculis TaxID=1843537 RepID=A0AAE1PRY9_9EUCA|nr:hypothetical protein Pmani_033403 [Petrolisthes manimaculis]KAK4312265.1 hypothetical protein Pmani_016278 [Petrolisthes manimaculis]